MLCSLLFSLATYHDDLLVTDRRCVNADPNYGPLWFHCHVHPADIPSRVVQRALTLLRHELLEAYPLYLRATLLFVQRCLNAARRRLAAKAGSNVEKARAPARNEAAANYVQDEDSKQQQQLPAVVDAINRAVETSGPSAVLQQHQHPQQQPLLLRDEGRERVDHAGDGDRNEDSIAAARPILQRLPGSGRLYCVQDFLTAIVEVNRAMYTPAAMLDEATRRRFLFSVDQII